MPYTGGMGLYFAVMTLTLIIAGAAQWYVSHQLKKYSHIPCSMGVTGAQMAQIMINDNNLGPVQVFRGGPGQDFFDPRNNSVTLDPDAYNYGSITSVATAVHEVGHACQYASGYTFMKFRSALVPVVNLASNTWIFVLFAGILLSSAGFIKAGILLFAATLLFQVVTLPVEFDASRRGLAYLQARGMVSGELAGASSVLRACALTYVAAALTSLLQLFYLFMSTREE